MTMHVHDVGPDYLLSFVLIAVVAMIRLNRITGAQGLPAED
jgi:hypothetical protein